MSKKAGLRFGKTRPQLDVVTGATVLCAASGASMPYTRKDVGDGGRLAGNLVSSMPSRGWGGAVPCPAKLWQATVSRWAIFFEATGRQGRGG